MAQFIPSPGPGAAPFAPRPLSPRGPYKQFGAPERLIHIHFPTDNTSSALPWYWYIPKQQPLFFSFISSNTGLPPEIAHGYIQAVWFPVIKILPIDTQPLIPVPPVGALSLIDAVTNYPPGAVWGRFDFRDNRFWELIIRQDGTGTNQNMPRAKPAFNQNRGLIQARDPGQNIAAQIKQGVDQFTNDWNTMAAQYVHLASLVLPGGGFLDNFQFIYRGQAEQPSLFNIPLPYSPTDVYTLEHAYDDFLNMFPAGANAAFPGPIPQSAFFDIIVYDTAAYAFHIAVGQLDPKKWNMSVFPPLDSTLIGNGSPSANSGDYNGFGGDPFPIVAPDIAPFA